MSAADSSRWPLDFEALSRGDVVQPETIEQAYGVSRADGKFRWLSMALAGDIEAYFRESRGDELLVKHDGDRLRLLTHPEQAREAQRRAALMVRGYGRALLKASGVDRTQLVDEERDKHDQFVRVTGWRVQQLRRQPPPELTA